MSTAGCFKWLAAALIMAVVMGCAESLQEQPPAQSGGSGATAPVVEQQDLPKIAVYVTGDVPNNEKDALGTRMLASLVNSGRYMAIERSNAFLAEIDKEHVKQRSGAIDDGQISELGKQFGVKFVCIAAITPAFGDFQISARIVDVETAVVVFIGESSGQLKSMDDLSRISDNVVENMFGGKTSKAQTPAVAVSKPKPASGTTFTDSRDGKVYRKIAVGTQTWMGENLNYNARGSKCYKNDPTNCEEYGRLYDWSTAMTACPAGWHLANDAEWKNLEKYAGSKAGNKLKSTTGWKKNTGTDYYGFLALPGGNGFGDGSFEDAGNYGSWWSATQINARAAWIRFMEYNGQRVYKTGSVKTDLFSVRCVEDK
jgi:uncharacterized protein (TIGR02145 family)